MLRIYVGELLVTLYNPIGYYMYIQFVSYFQSILKSFDHLK
jgi:hypothetical protein